VKQADEFKAKYDKLQQELEKSLNMKGWDD